MLQIASKWYHILKICNYTLFRCDISGSWRMNRYSHCSQLLRRLCRGLLKMIEHKNLKRIVDLHKKVEDLIDESGLRSLTSTERMIVLALEDLSDENFSCAASDLATHRFMSDKSRPTIQRGLAHLKALNVIKTSGGVTNRRYKLCLTEFQEPVPIQT